MTEEIFDKATRDKAASKRAAEIQTGWTAPPSLRPSLQKGHLIAVEGTGGKILSAAAKRLQKTLRKPSIQVGVSTWDASGIFYEILDGPREVDGATPRTVLLLYAADLAFRLRWQIMPALEDGVTVIAAPYVETGMALGRALGVSEKWLHELFSFAPHAHATYRVDEDNVPFQQRGKPAENFIEFAFLHLRRGKGQWITDEIRREVLELLKKQPKSQLLTTELLHSLRIQQTI